MPDRPTDVTSLPAPGAGAGGCCASRRQVLRAGGAAALAPLAAGALAACGGGGGSPSTAQVADDGTVTVPSGDTPVGGATYYADPKVVVTQPTEGDYRAFDATCPHQGCATSSFEAGVLRCPCHGSEFDPATGEVLGGPAQTGLTALAASLDGGDVVIRG